MRKTVRIYLLNRKKIFILIKVMDSKKIMQRIIILKVYYSVVLISIDVFYSII